MQLVIDTHILLKQLCKEGFQLLVSYNHQSKNSTEGLF